MVRHQEQGLWQYFPLVVLGSLANWRGEEPGDIVPRAVSGELLRTSQFPSHRQHSMPPDLIVHPLARTQNCSVSPLHCMQRAPCSLSHYHALAIRAFFIVVSRIEYRCLSVQCVPLRLPHLHRPTAVPVSPPLCRTVEGLEVQ